MAMLIILLTATTMPPHRNSGDRLRWSGLSHWLMFQFIRSPTPLVPEHRTLPL